MGFSDIYVEKIQKIKQKKKKFFLNREKELPVS